MKCIAVFAATSLANNSIICGGINKIEDNCGGINERAIYNKFCSGKWKKAEIALLALLLNALEEEYHGLEGSQSIGENLKKAYHALADEKLLAVENILLWIDAWIVGKPSAEFVGKPSAIEDIICKGADLLGAASNSEKKKAIYVKFCDNKGLDGAAEKTLLALKDNSLENNNEREVVV